jgi:hypothetical protein
LGRVTLLTTTCEFYGCALSVGSAVGPFAASFGDTVRSLVVRRSPCEQRSRAAAWKSQKEQSSDVMSVVRKIIDIASTADIPVELVLVSPMTRCLETWLYGVRPILVGLVVIPASSITPVPCIVLPLATGCVYTGSDTGGRLSLQELQSAFSQPDWIAYQRQRQRQ